MGRGPQRIGCIAKCAGMHEFRGHRSKPLPKCGPAYLDSGMTRLS